MSSLIQKNSNDYNVLLNSVGVLLEKARKEVYYQINQTLVKTYWEIGQRIVDYEQQGKEKAEYGSKLLDKLSQDLKLRYGRGFSRRNVLDMRRFYLYFPKWQTLSTKLSWSHYVEYLIVKCGLKITGEH